MVQLEGYIRVKMPAKNSKKNKDDEHTTAPKTIKCFFSSVGDEVKPFGSDDLPVDVFVEKLKAYLEAL